MSDAKGQQHEPSMEEILASIRRIIAEDGEPAAEGGLDPNPEPIPGIADAAHDDILELTEVVDAEGDLVSLNSGQSAAENRAPPAPQPAATPYVLAEESSTPPVDPHFAEEPIVSQETAAASIAALSQISSLSSPDRSRRSDISVGSGDLTLEAIVRSELRPILRDWLDENLPDLVERLVQQEIARLVSATKRR